MVLNPEVMKKAQAELDVLTRNGERLPTMDDRPALPYIDAIVKEVYRYVASISIPLNILTLYIIIIQQLSPRWPNG